jgi:hypothetical protein
MAICCSTHPGHTACSPTITWTTGECLLRFVRSACPPFACLVIFSWMLEPAGDSALYEPIHRLEPSHEHVKMLWRRWFHYATVNRSVWLAFTLLLVDFQRITAELEASSKVVEKIAQGQSLELRCHARTLNREGKEAETAIYRPEQCTNKSKRPDEFSAEGRQILEAYRTGWMSRRKRQTWKLNKKIWQAKMEVFCLVTCAPWLRSCEFRCSLSLCQAWRFDA